MRTIFGIVTLAILAALAVMAWAFSGVYYSGADRPHPVPIAWFLDLTMTRSVHAHARDIPVPPLAEPAMVAAGAKDYDAHCRACHGAPGFPQKAFAHHMLPAAPRLARAEEEWTGADLYWIIKHGVRMTGMPAWGPVLSDEHIWDLVAFLREMPAMTEASYAELVGQGPSPAAPPQPAQPRQPPQQR